MVNLFRVISVEWRDQGLERIIELLGGVWEVEKFLSKDVLRLEISTIWKCAVLLKGDSSQYIHMSNRHIVHLKYLKMLFVTCTSMKQ